MIRRWSYLNFCNVSHTVKNLCFTDVHLRKTFKNAVKFKKFSKNLSKPVRKKYASRKITNSNYNLLTYAYFWVKSYNKFLFLEKCVHAANLYSLKKDSNLSFKQYWNNSVALNKILGYHFLSSRLSHTFYSISLKHSYEFSYLGKTSRNSTFLELDYTFFMKHSLSVFRFNKLLRKMFILCIIKNIFRSQALKN
jgi:hypothetical protein